jgi:hypothetical protein
LLPSSEETAAPGRGRDPIGIFRIFIGDPGYKIPVNDEIPSLRPEYTGIRAVPEYPEVERTKPARTVF